MHKIRPELTVTYIISSKNVLEVPMHMLMGVSSRFLCQQDQYTQAQDLLS